MLNLSIKVQSLELIHANDFFMGIQSLLSKPPPHKILVSKLILLIRKAILLYIEMNSIVVHLKYEMMKEDDEMEKLYAAVSL